MRNIDDIILQTKNGQHSQLNSLILYGNPGTGTTTIAVKAAIKCKFPFVKIICP